MNTTLGRLDLDFVDVGEKGAVALADHFSDTRFNTALTALSLTGSNINDTGTAPPASVSCRVVYPHLPLPDRHARALQPVEAFGGAS